VSEQDKCQVASCKNTRKLYSRFCEEHFVLGDMGESSQGEAKPVNRQRIVVRKCRAKLLIPVNNDGPAETVFVCQLDKGHSDSHQEVGSVDMDNGTARMYTIVWDDLGFVQSRRRKSKAK
jgi:hypothetical protein